MALPTPQWIDTPAQLEALVARHRCAATYAIDTEFMSGVHYRPILALVQLAVEDHIYLIDPLVCSLTPLATLLTGPGVMLVHAAQGDLELLEQACGVKPSKIFDTQIAGQFLGLSSPSLATVVKIEVGAELDKSARMSDWTKRPLSSHARSYAALDVAYLHEVYESQMAQLHQSQKLDWCEEECERLRVVDRSPADPRDAWRRLRGILTMSEIERHRALLLSAWRESLAEKKDRIPNRVWSDDSLLAVIRRAPKTIEQLGKIRGTEVLDAPSKNAVLAALKAAESSRADVTVTKELRDERAFDALINLVMAALWQIGRDAQVDPAMLASRADVVAWLCAQPSRVDVGWRSTHLVPLLSEIHQGRAVISADGRTLQVADRSTGQSLQLLKDPA